MMPRSELHSSVRSQYGRFNNALKHGQGRLRVSQEIADHMHGRKHDVFLFTVEYPCRHARKNVTHAIFRERAGNRPVFIVPINAGWNTSEAKEKGVTVV